MKYPVLANWIRFRRISGDEYEIIDLLNDEIIQADAYTVWFARQLNGKRDPYRIDRNVAGEDVTLLLETLKKENIIRDKRFYSKFFLYLLVTVWQPKITPAVRVASFIINGLLLISFLPFLAFGIFYFIKYSDDMNVDYFMTGAIVGMVVGIALHELGHMISCLGYGGRVFEVGVMLQFLVFPGAYVLLNTNNIKRRMRRIQVSAAGIEMNFLLTAIFLILAARYEPLSGFFFGAAIQNGFLAFLNLTFVNGFDGMNIISELLGVEDLVDKAKRITKSNFMKRRLRKDGISGMATIAVCYAFKGVQIALPLLFALNIMGVFVWFS